jgi:hypothetical protein
MNSNIRKVMEALEILRSVEGCELERLSLSGKLKSMYEQNIDWSTKNGIELIDCMDDDQLTAAIYNRDSRIGFGAFLDPELFNYVRRNRGSCIQNADKFLKM